MRALWKGSISFGLVTIPVALYPATRREEIRFRLLRASDLSPINYKRVAEADGKEVPWDQIVKGYEYEKGKFVVLKDEDFKRVDVEATQSVDITSFVELSEINPIFFYKPYLLEPEKGGSHAYSLLRDVLKDTGKTGIAKVVIRERQHLAAVKPQGDALVLELMHFNAELADLSHLKLPASAKAHARGRELQMASTLVEQMTDKWNPADYKDDYSDAVKKLIDQKVASGGKLPPAPKAKPRHGNVVDLVQVLQESLDKASQSKKKKPRGQRKAA